MSSQTMNSLRSDDGLYIGHWMQQRTREKLAATNKRQLIWVAKALLDGSAGTREDLLALFNIQTNVLMLTFVGSCALFTVLPGAAEAAHPEWYPVCLMAGSAAMLWPLVGASLALILAGNVRFRAKALFVEYLLDSPTLTGATAPLIFQSASAFCVLLTVTMLQLAVDGWVVWATAGLSLVAFAAVVRGNKQQNAKTHAAALRVLQHWSDTLRGGAASLTPVTKTTPASAAGGGGGGGGGGVRAAPQSAPVKVAPSARLQKLESIKADALSRFNRMSKSKAI